MRWRGVGVREEGGGGRRREPVAKRRRRKEGGRRRKRAVRRLRARHRKQKSVLIRVEGMEMKLTL